MATTAVIVAISYNLETVCLCLAILRMYTYSGFQDCITQSQYCINSICSGMCKLDTADARSLAESDSNNYFIVSNLSHCSDYPGYALILVPSLRGNIFVGHPLTLELLCSFNYLRKTYGDIFSLTLLNMSALNNVRLGLQCKQKV